MLLASFRLKNSVRFVTQCGIKAKQSATLATPSFGLSSVEKIRWKMKQKHKRTHT